MNVNLPQDLNDFVTGQVRDGGYTNQSEIVREALRLLRDRTEKLRKLNKHLDLGLADAAEQRTKPLTDDLLIDIAKRARANHKKRQ